MDQSRYTELEQTGEDPTQEEFEQGWHFCDGLLVGPPMFDFYIHCTCLRESHPAHAEQQRGKKEILRRCRLD
jgi:hypothetical protein